MGKEHGTYSACDGKKIFYLKNQAREGNDKIQNRRTGFSVCL